MADTSGADDLLARVEALREAGAAEREPVRFAYLEALSRRAAGQPASIQASLRQKLAALADELSRPSAPAIKAIQPDSPSPLAALLQHIGQHDQPVNSLSDASRAASTVNPKKRPKSARPVGNQAPELRAVAIFRDAWSKLSTEQQLTQTLAQAPENAGPMNSQHLVLRSLEMMRDLAPDYLQGFMSYIDTLIWLAQDDLLKIDSARSPADKRVAKLGARKRKSGNH